MSSVFVLVATISIVFATNITQTISSAENESDEFTSCDSDFQSDNDSTTGTDTATDTNTDIDTDTDTDTESENKLQLNETDLKMVLPDIKTFKKKYKTLRKKLRRKIIKFGVLRISVNRKSVFVESFNQIQKLAVRKLRRRWMWVNFKKEKQFDVMAGLTKVWFSLLSEQIFGPLGGLFKYVKKNNYGLQIDPMSIVRNSDYLEKFKFAGKFIGLAILHGKTIKASLIKPFYMTILKKEVKLEDVETIDPEFYQHLISIKYNPEDQILNFSIIEEAPFGKKIVYELKQDGQQIPVTKYNVDEYIDLVIQREYVSRVHDQMSNILEGLGQLVPLEFLREFDENEMQILFCGIQEIDVDDWKRNTDYLWGYNKNSDIVKWFWEIIDEFDYDQRAKILQFVTGTNIVPIEGFKTYRPFPFAIIKRGTPEDLPDSDTSFRHFFLPPYETKDRLRTELLEITKKSVTNLYQPKWLKNEKNESPKAKLIV